MIESSAQLPRALTPKIIFEDTHVVVLSKPSGLLSQGEKTGDQNLVDWLRGYFGRHYVGLIHRLDRNTSGIMVVAKRTKSASRLSEALRDDQIKRDYLGWMVGKLSTKVRWVHFLEKDNERNRTRVSRLGPKAKESILTAEPVKHSIWRNTSITLARFQLETGRSHQIRVQSSYEKLPLLGDTKYGHPELAFSRLALHSFQIEFPHPMSGETLKFEDPLPIDLQL